jgi:hypothetical protein
MAMARKPELMQWREVLNDDGTPRGRYAIDGLMMIVRSSQGWQKTVRAGPASFYASLASIVLSEPPPP